MAATTLEQSRKLIELGIDPETADMHYSFMVIGGSAFQDMIDNLATLLPGKKNTKYHYEPAWSLSALLSQMPCVELVSSKDNHYRAFWHEMYSDWHENAVDACVEILLRVGKEGEQ